MALSANRTDLGLNNSGLVVLKLGASQTIYQGAMVTVGDSSGLAFPAAASAANRTFIGVALHYAKSGASGDVYVTVQTQGEFEVTTASAAQSWVGDYAYVTDDETCDNTKGTNLLVAGYFSQYISSTKMKVTMFPYRAALPA